MSVIADSHLHLFREGFAARYGRGPLGLGHEVEAYERLRVEHGIRAGLVIGYEGEGIEPDNNRYVRSLAATRPWMTTVAHVTPEAVRAVDDLEALLDQGHRGVALYLQRPEATRAVLAWPSAAWRRLDERQALISLNAVPEATAALAPIVEGHPRCTFLFSHLGLPGRWPGAPSPGAAEARLAALLGLARLANTIVKISGLYAVSDPPHGYPHEAATPFLDTVLQGFGADRCCWGSDFSPCLDFVSFTQAAAIPWLDRLPAADHDKVMGDNLLRLLGR